MATTRINLRLDESTYNDILAAIAAEEKKTGLEITISAWIKRAIKQALLSGAEKKGE